MGFGLVNGFLDHLQVVTTNKYSIVTIFTLYSSLENTNYFFFQSVTRGFLVTAPTVAIHLPSVQVFSSQTPVQN
jgi:hypothetical protein